MIKIIYYSPHPQLNLTAATGYGTHMREMINALRQNGYDVKTLIAGGEYAVDPKAKPKKGKKHMQKRIIPELWWETLKDIRLLYHDYKMAKRLRRLVKQEKPVLIYERVAYGQNSGVLVAKKFNIKHIAEVNAPYPEERVYFSGNSLMLKKGHRIEEEILTKTTAAFVVSSDLKKYLTEKIGIHPDKVFVVPNSVNPEKITIDERKIDILRQDYGLKNRLVFGFVGSVFPYHGVDLLVKAFAQMEHAEKYKLLIVGDGETLENIKLLSQKLKINSQLVFTGSILNKEVYNHIALMDICLMVRSNWYGSPVKIFEYGALGKAVIAPDVGPIHDVMKNNDAIFVKPVVSEIKDAMILLSNDETLRLRMGQSWQKKVLLKYTWQNAAKRVDQVIASDEELFETELLN